MPESWGEIGSPRFGGSSAATPARDGFEGIFLGGLLELDRLREAASDAPVIRFVNAMLASAVDERVSDVHIEPTADGLTVRFRIDTHCI